MEIVGTRAKDLSPGAWLGRAFGVLILIVFALRQTPSPEPTPSDTAPSQTPTPSTTPTPDTVAISAADYVNRPFADVESELDRTPRRR